MIVPDIYLSIYGRRIMDEDDPGVSPALDKPPGEDEAITHPSMMKRYKVNNELPYC